LYFGKLPQIAKNNTIPQVPATQYVVQTTFELDEVPHVEESNVISSKFLLQCNAPDYEISYEGAMSLNSGQCPSLRDKSCNSGQSMVVPVTQKMFS